MYTDEDEAFVGFGGAFHPAEELRHEILRWDVFQIRSARHFSSSSSSAAATANADLSFFRVIFSSLLGGFGMREN